MLGTTWINHAKKQVWSSVRRFHSNQLAFVFDIDGVLIRGGRPIAAAQPALQTLQSKKIPFMLLTNGGGVTEKARTLYLLDLLGVKIDPRQIVQLHTPFLMLANKYKRVLVVGGPNDTSRDAAIAYGFKDVVRPVDVLKKDPSVWPFHKYSKQEINEWGRDTDLSLPFDAVFVFNDPRDMGSDLQIVTDLLVSDGGHLGTRRPKSTDSSKPSVPVFFSNNDLLWANENPLPRLGQGAFRISLEAVYQLVTGHPLEDVIIGKPFRVTYRYVDRALANWVGENKPFAWDEPVKSPFKNVYMVGDNPASDIHGAVGYGWNSCLVRTGVYRDGDVLDVEPTFIVDTVYDAVMKGIEGVEK